MNNYYPAESYFWGNIYRLLPEFRDGNKLKNPDMGHWFMGSEDNRGTNYPLYLDKIKEKDFEMKYWEFNIGMNLHQQKEQKHAKEYNFILEGEIMGSVHTMKNINLKAGDFIEINSGFRTNLQEKVLDYTKGITIKIPAIKNDTIKF